MGFMVRSASADADLSPKRRAGIGLMHPIDARAQNRFSSGAMIFRLHSLAASGGLRLRCARERRRGDA
jgi:hypothetical protein